MSFLEHLEELRWHIIKALIGLLLATIVCGIYADFIVQDLLMKPLRAAGLKAQVLAPYGIVLLYMQTVLICGLILSMPNTLYWLWKFVAPGLLPRERRYVGRLVFFTSLCFFGGVAFSYFILLPTSLTFFSGFGTTTIDLNIAVDHYVSFILTLLLGAGLVFELPMVSYFLTKIGFLTPEFMRQYRRHSIVVILILSALVTPTPDPMTQIMLAVPMLLLYETSIFVSKLALRRTAAEKQESEPSVAADKEPT
ncbi:MAG TPA: twin-arginine translocase subunit TatC [Bacteroidota bacterium]